jgi:dihydroorotase
MKITLTNGELINTEGQRVPFKTLCVDEGLIKSLDQDLEPGTQTIDCQGKLIVPTLTDLSMKVSSIKGIGQELRAAASGGVGRVCLMPNTSPINDAPAISKLIEQQAELSNGAELIMVGAMTNHLEGKLLSEYAELRDAGCKALSNGFCAVDSLAITKRCFDYAHTFDMTIFMHPMVRSLYEGSMHSGTTSTMLGLKGIPEIAETIAIAQLCLLAEASGVRLHLSNLSCEHSVELVREAKKKGARISADVAIANLFYTDQDVQGYDNNFHTIPPLRSEHDRRALIQGVLDGTIDAICSGHEPRSSSAKNAPFAESATGISNIEHLFHYAIALEDAGLPLETFIAAMSTRSSEVLGLEDRQIKVGKNANFTIVNLDGESVNAGTIRSAGHNSPLLGQKTNSKVEHTFIDGVLVYSAN